jgi:hypothetical protein
MEIGPPGLPGGHFPKSPAFFSPGAAGRQRLEAGHEVHSGPPGFSHQVMDRAQPVTGHAMGRPGSQAVPVTGRLHLPQPRTTETASVPEEHDPRLPAGETKAFQDGPSSQVEYRR